MIATNGNKDYVKIFKKIGFIPYKEPGESAGVGDFSGDELVGDCPFCRKVGKFYLNRLTGLWSCKAGHCGKQGNLYNYLQFYWDKLHDEGSSLDYQDDWERLSADRSIPVELLEECGVVFDTRLKRYLIPVHNAKGALVNFKTYVPPIPGGEPAKLLGLPELESGIFNLHNLNCSSVVYVCEGEWDAIALIGLLAQALSEEDLKETSVVGVPGAAVFKDEWAQHFSGKKCILCYDHDIDGTKGAKRAAGKLVQVAGEVHNLRWPDSERTGYDVRDFVGDGREFDEFRTLIRPMPVAGHGIAKMPSGGQFDSENKPVDGRHTSPPDLSGPKPPFEAVIASYEKHLAMSEEYQWALRVAFAVVLSQKINGDPLWIYLVAPPSSGKTVILQSLSDVESCVLRSTVTAASLVSGWRGQQDPSLIPQLDGKTFVLKDFTEILAINRTLRDEIYAILRGAYDGLVEKSFGHGVTRTYNPHFSFLAGVTQAIFAERSASLGERALMFHVIRGNEHDSEESIMRALNNVGKENEIRHELAQAARDYLERPLPDEDAEIAMEALSTKDSHDRISALCQLVAMLRGQVHMDFREEKLLYRPQIELGGRLGKQLKKLAVSLSLLETPIAATERVWEIVTRIAFDTCIGFNLDVVQALSLTDRSDIYRLSRVTDIPVATLHGRLDDLELFGVISSQKVDNLSPSGRGAPMKLYSMSERARTLWRKCGLHWQIVDEEDVIKLELSRRRR